MYNKSTKDKLECHIITLAMTVGLFSTFAVCESFLSSADSSRATAHAHVTGNSSNHITLVVV